MDGLSWAWSIFFFWKTSPKCLLDLIADDMRALLEHLELEKVIILGQSMGGTIALHFASLYPDIVDKMVLQGARIWSISNFANGSSRESRMVGNVKAK